MAPAIPNTNQKHSLGKGGRVVCLYSEETVKDKPVFYFMWIQPMSLCVQAPKICSMNLPRARLAL